MYAYALPIETTFRSIREKIKAAEVRLPSEAETRIFDIEKLSPTSRWSKSVVFELDLLYAIRHSEETLRTQNLDLGGVPPGTGWLGMRRTEVLGPEPNLKNRVYRRLASLKIDTIRSLIRIGHIFPLDDMFRTGLREWVVDHKVSHVHVTRAAAVRVILDECLGTVAGENLLSLIFTLKILLRFETAPADEEGTHKQLAAEIQRLFMAIFKALDVPPTRIPSETQVEAFALHCLTGFKGIPQIELSERLSLSRHALDVTRTKKSTAESLLLLRSRKLRPARHRLRTEDNSKEKRIPKLPVREFAQMLLQLSDVAHSNGRKVFVCAGTPWADCARGVAPLLGLSVHARSCNSGELFESESTDDVASSVMVFVDVEYVVLEVMDKHALPSFLGFSDDQKDSWRRVSQPLETATKRRKWSLGVIRRKKSNRHALAIESSIELGAI